VKLASMSINACSDASLCIGGNALMSRRPYPIETSRLSQTTKTP
jgi:hypothetical protein